jgi:hypothetical protein
MHTSDVKIVFPMVMQSMMVQVLLVWCGLVYRICSLSQNSQNSQTNSPPTDFTGLEQPVDRPRRGTAF